jgi:hypothetical protein
MPWRPHPFLHARAKFALTLAGVLLLASLVVAETPKLKIRTESGLPLEEQGKQQLERLAKQYDLSKFTITRDILIERGAVNHSRPVLTLNMRFFDDDDLLLSAYVHEQAHWLITDGHPHDARVFSKTCSRLSRISIIMFPRVMGSSAAVISTSPCACLNGKLWRNWSVPNGLFAKWSGNSRIITRRLRVGCRESRSTREDFEGPQY